MKLIICLYIILTAFKFSQCSNNDLRWEKFRLKFYNCQTWDEITPSYLNRRSWYGHASFPFWTVFFRQFKLAFGIRRNDKWYFMDVDQQKLIEMKTKQTNRSLVYKLKKTNFLQHVATGRFVAVRNGKLRLVSSMSDATRFCMSSFIM